MSDKPAAIPQMAPMPGSEKHSAACPKCGTMLRFVFQQPITMRARTSTVVLIEHTKAHCGGCGRDWAATIVCNGIAFSGVMEIPPESAILSPHGVSVPPIQA